MTSSVSDRGTEKSVHEGQRSVVGVVKVVSSDRRLKDTDSEDPVR